MKKIVVVLGVALVLAVGFAVQSSLHANNLEKQINSLQIERNNLASRLEHSQKDRATLQARLQPHEQRRAAMTRISKEVDVSVGTVQGFTFTPALVPGTLSGTWRSSGKGWGGSDDTISGFRLTDPNDSVLESSLRGSSGRFLVKVSAQGKYSFYFENAGLFRTTPRKVFVEAEYKPD